MKLNLASGQWPSDRFHLIDAWVDVDLPWDGVITPDVYGDAFCLPFPDGAFDGAYVGHFLEHIDANLVRPALVELRRVLAPESAVAFVGPDINLARSTRQPEWLLRAIDTLGTGPGGHKWVCTEELMLALVRRVFPDAVSVPVRLVDRPHWPNPSVANWQCAMVATA